MSYHVQQNTQQRSIGIFIVIAFHVLLIWALATGLGTTIATLITPDSIKLTPVEKQIVPPPTAEPQEPVINNRTQINIDPNISTNITFDDALPPLVTSTGSSESVIPSNLSRAKLLKASKPDYPSAAARLSEEGATGLKLLINAAGRVTDVQLISSSGSTRLDDAAIKHAKRNWVFSPCTEGGKAIACWHQTKLVWQLKDAGR